MSGSSTRYVPSFSHAGLTVVTIIVPTITPGSSPITMGSTRFQTAPSASRLTKSTYAFSATSMRTRAGLRVRFVRNSSASGTVIDEKPYPRPPFTTAANRVMATRAMTCVFMIDRQDTSRVLLSEADLVLDQNRVLGVSWTVRRAVEDSALDVERPLDDGIQVPVRADRECPRFMARTGGRQSAGDCQGI